MKESNPLDKELLRQQAQTLARKENELKKMNERQFKAGTLQETAAFLSRERMMENLRSNMTDRFNQMNS